MSLLCHRPLLCGTMSLGKENGREMMRDAFGRVRLEDHVARLKKKARRIGEADPRGAGRARIAPREARSLAKRRKIRAIAMIARGLKLPFLPYISHRVIAYLDPCARVADALDDF